MFKTEEEKLLPGEKLEGIGFMVFLIAGAGLDGTDWICLLYTSPSPRDRG